MRWIMRIKGYELDIDFAEELDPYMDEFSRAQVRGEKLQSCSPFRHESTPSFAVNLDNGTWIDSGASDEDWYKGNFVKLLSYLMGTTYEEAEDYLIAKYRLILDDTEALTLDIQLEDDKDYRELTVDDLEPYAYRSTYLGNRGISERVQRAFQIGYDRSSNAVTFAWHDKKGSIINIKFRKTETKVFWYLKDGQPIKQHIYGLHMVYKTGAKRVFIVESETDALYLWSHKIPAVALGSASLSKKQEELLLSSPIEEIVLAFDRDSAGSRARDHVTSRLLGKKQISIMPIPVGCKDINDIKSENLIKATQEAYTYEPEFKLT